MLETLPAKKIIQMITLTAGVMMAAGVVYYILTANIYEALPFAVGVAATAALNILKMKMLARSVRKALEMDDPNRGKYYAVGMYMLRYFLTGAVLVAIGLLHVYLENPRIISIWGALFGLFTMQIAIFISRPSKLIDTTSQYDPIPYDDEDDGNDDDNDKDAKDNNSGNE
ncbi:MAG: hypothetical protein FWH17_04985 [Oscillospiraceae bacterium]|nr:hypothetical protein [Oscillospiraceae bacterium]